MRSAQPCRGPGLNNNLKPDPQTGSPNNRQPSNLSGSSHPQRVFLGGVPTLRNQAKSNESIISREKAGVFVVIAPAGSQRGGERVELKDLCKLIEILDGSKTPQPDGVDGPWRVGKKYFIRTVTMHLTGELTEVTRQELVLKDAAWIADSGRFSEAVRDPSKCAEVEPFNRPAIVGRGSIVDATEIPHIITEVK